MFKFCTYIALVILFAALGTIAQGAEPFVPERPQEPTGSLPYRVQEITFEGAGKIHLSGTLTLPDEVGPFPGIVLIAGAGPHDRDGLFMTHRPLLVLADHLTRAGFAVLRFDERGVADSEGEFAPATAEELAADIAAGAKILRRHDDVDSEKVGLLAHSEGGRLSALAIETHDAADFLVLLGAPARPGIEGLRAQAAQSQNPVAQLQAAMAESALNTDAGADIESSMRGAASGVLDDLTKGQRAAFGGNEEVIVNQLAQALSQPQARFSLEFDPRPALKQARLPMLALYGDKDRQIDVAGTIQAWREALGDDIKTTTIANLNHFFQEAGTGAPSEYATIKQTIAPEALERIIGWLTSVNEG